MSGPSNAQTDVVWPGYVAAMASLLLSLLLVAAVLVVTISQIGSVSDSYQRAIESTGFKSRRDVDRVARLAGLPEDSGAQLVVPDKNQQLPKAVTDATAADRQKADAPVAADSKPPYVAQPSADALPILDLSRAIFDPVAAREAAEIAANDKELLAQIDLSKVDITKIKLKGIDISNIDLSRQISLADMQNIDFSQANLGEIDPARLALLKPFIAKEAIRYQLLLKLQRKRQLQLQQQRQKAAPVVRPKVTAAPTAVSPAAKPNPAGPAPLPDRLQIVYIEEAPELLPEQKQQILQALTTMQTQVTALRIWTQMPNEDVYLKRTAYSRLIAIRSLAVEAGFASSKVQLDMVTVPNMPVPQSDMVIYIAEQKK